ncbi:alpha/beta hydrolase-fold protein [Pseudarthrobacter sp. PS3-L1]|uniref:alpha/beta hydrolase n=1 Tax=Pseudarthrobacter sp. PS3-L1 TaxID=3046207 RepID=UPI0024B99E5B|nr:alpha/beta hydrolase-fold protein [Pseudarthrobacter sp. PS3-L1]MDJ0319931.1 alpha/beta hydrolase-fold protein [Pseudarthrobacter sp. PS3-L1]
MNISNVNLTNGVVPILTGVLGAAGLLWLVVLSLRKDLRRTILSTAVAFILSVGLWFVTERIWNIWGAPQPPELYIPIGMAFLALVLGAQQLFRRARIHNKIITASSIAFVLVASTTTINSHYGTYPTIGSLVGTNVKLETLPTTPPGTGTGSTSVPLTREATWVPPQTMPTKGFVSEVTIPGPTSGVTAGKGYVWLPPAYLATPQASVPVLVLFHGVPGGPKDWLTGGQLADFMDTYASAHKGLAPIVVMPDANQGSVTEPSLCMDTSHGKAATYLAVDVPNWVKTVLHAGQGPATNWAVAGFSYGGTCALQLAVNFPQIYPSFIDISGENMPTVPAGTRALITSYFSGNTTAFSQQNPLDVIKNGHFPTTAGLITVGADDSFYKPQGEQIYAAAQAAGMDVTLQVLPGSHSWQAWRPGLENNLNWLMNRYGVIP